MNATYDLIVVGEGIAGLTCAAESAKVGLQVATFESAFFGGLAVNIYELKNFKEAGGLSGMDHAGMLASGNKKAGVKSSPTAVTAVRIIEGGFEVDTHAGKHTARFVVIASGAHLKKLNVPGEMEFEGRGVSHCADCDAPMFTESDVIVAGSGDWALQDALLLARECTKVHVVYEEKELTACAEYIQRVKNEPKIILQPNLKIYEILGNDNGMTGVRVTDAQDTTSEISAKGLFAIVGLIPNSALAPVEVARDDHGFLQVNEDLETVVPGLWAIGQVRSGFQGWLNHAVGDARRVAEIVKDRTS